MKNLIILLALTTSFSVFSMPLPMNQSISTVEALLDLIKEDNSLSYSSISKIIVSDPISKVELIDRDGNCNAYAFEIKYNELGEQSVQFAKDILVTCY